MKEYERDVRVACTETGAVSEHANKTSHFLTGTTLNV